MTIPGVQLWHYITDDQLTTLGEMRKEPVMEICLATSGTFVGAIVPAIEQLARFNDKANPMGLIGLVTVAIAFVAFGISAVTAILWRQRHISHEGLLRVIQSRRKVPVATDH